MSNCLETSDPCFFSKVTKGSPDKSSWDLPCVSPPVLALEREQSSGTSGHCVLQESREHEVPMVKMCRCVLTGCRPSQQSCLSWESSPATALLPAKVCSAWVCVAEPLAVQGLLLRGEPGLMCLDSFESVKTAKKTQVRRITGRCVHRGMARWLFPLPCLCFRGAGKASHQPSALL